MLNLDQRPKLCHFKRFRLQSKSKSAVGEVAGILTSAVKDVAGAIGGLATEVFEIRDAAKRAAEQQEPPASEELD